MLISLAHPTENLQSFWGLQRSMIHVDLHGGGLLAMIDGKSMLGRTSLALGGMIRSLVISYTGHVAISAISCRHNGKALRVLWHQF